MKFAYLFILALFIAFTEARLKATIFNKQPEFIRFADNLPQQLHLNLGSFDSTSVIVTFSTQAQLSNPTVFYGTSQDNLDQKAIPVKVNQYSYNFGSYNEYSSNFIYHTNLTDLKPLQTYYYKVGDDAPNTLLSSVNSFTMPNAVGPDAEVVLGVVGDIGQTVNSNQTIQKLIQDSKINAILHAGDLSYADGDGKRWDSYQLLIEPLSSKKFLQFCPGNHEKEQDSVTKEYFVNYQNRFLQPAASSGSNGGNLYYSFEIGSVHVIFLNSYSDYTEGSDQYNWLLSDLQKVDRTRTPWLLVSFHAPWYNSNTAHQNEKEPIGMKKTLEDILNQYQVDFIFSGHVHAYERNYPVYKGVKNESAPVYITIGDGGNREGLANAWLAQPEYSAFREASYGHGIFHVYNRTNALFTWQKNSDDSTIVSDQVQFVKTVEQGVKKIKTIKDGKLLTDNQENKDYKRKGPSREFTIEEIRRNYL